MKTKHTPTPWVYDYGNCEIESVKDRWGVCSFFDLNRTGFDSQGKEVLNPVDPIKDAEYIVHCVNTHDEMLEALRCVHNMVKGFDCATHCNQSDTDMLGHHPSCTMLRSVGPIIAKAEGRSGEGKRFRE